MKLKVKDDFIRFLRVSPAAMKFKTAAATLLCAGGEDVNKKFVFGFYLKMIFFRIGQHNNHFSEHTAKLYF